MAISPTQAIDKSIALVCFPFSVFYLLAFVPCVYFTICLRRVSFSSIFFFAHFAARRAENTRGVTNKSSGIQLQFRFAY